MGFDHISAAASAVDWIAKNELEVVYFIGSSTPGQEDLHPRNLRNGRRGTTRAVPTLIEVWRGAEYHERETHEMFGG